MNMKVYRNIYFYGNRILKEGKGVIDIQYTGSIFNNAKNIKSFDNEFDEDQDLLITCNDCASKKYRYIIKKK